MPLFGKSSKSPPEVVKLLKENLMTLEKGGDGKKQEKAQECCRNLTDNLYFIIYIIGNLLIRYILRILQLVCILPLTKHFFFLNIKVKNTIGSSFQIFTP